MSWVGDTWNNVKNDPWGTAKSVGIASATGFVHPFGSYGAMWDAAKGGPGSVSGGDDPYGFNGKGITAGPDNVTARNVPGLQQGTPLEGDYNLQGPGAGEQYYGAAANFYAQPGFGDNYWNQNQSQFGMPGAGEQYWQQKQQQVGAGPQGLTRNSQQAYNDARGLSADMSPFYDRAKERAISDVDKSFGARGMFGSSAATGQIGQTVSDLEAQRSRDEAQYGLQRAGLLGSLGQGADSANLGNAGMGLNWLQTGQGMAQGAQNAQLQRLLGGGQLAQGFDANALNRVNSGMNAALGAQGAREGRIQNMFNNVSQPGMALFGMQGNYYPQMLQNDMALMDSSALMGTGLAQDMMNRDDRRTDMTEQDTKTLMSLFSGGMGGGGGMGGIMGMGGSFGGM